MKNGEVKARKKQERAARRAIKRELSEKRREYKKLIKADKREQRAEAKRKAALTKDLTLVDPETTLREDYGRERKKRHKASHLADAISLEKAYSDGIWETEEGLFSQTLTFRDITYQSAPEESRVKLLTEYSALLNGFTPDYALQLTLVNRRLSRTGSGDQEFYKTVDPALTPYVEEYNAILNDLMEKGVSNLLKERYLTIATKAEDYAQAKRKLAQASYHAADRLKSMGADSESLDGAARLRLTQSIARPGSPFMFTYEDYVYGGGPAPLESVLPPSIDFAPSAQGNYFYIPADHRYMCALAFDSSAYGKIKDSSLAAIAALDMPLAVSVHLQPISPQKSSEDLNRKRMYINDQIIKEQQKAHDRHFNQEIVSPLIKKYAQAVEVSDEQLSSTNTDPQHEFEASGVVLIWADDVEELRDHAEKVTRAAASGGITLIELDCMQELGYNASLPLGVDHIPYSRRLFTHQVALFTPFAQEEIWDEGGVYVGQNANSNNLTLISRRSLVQIQPPRPRNRRSDG